MHRRHFTPALAAACLFLCAACGGSRQSAQDDRPPLVPEHMREDINGRWVRVPAADGKTEPISWVFDPTEPKQIDILEQKLEGDTATFLVQMQTHTGPRARNPRSLSGQLRVHYRLESGLVLRQWQIDEVENVSFKYVNEPKPDANANATNANGNSNAKANANDKTGASDKTKANANAPASPTR
jgi:hypothetical protein